MSLTVAIRDPISSRYKRSSKEGLLDNFTLIDVKEALEALYVRAAPKDIPSSLSALQVDFSSGQMRANFADAEAPKYLVTTTAAAQLAQEVLPPRFWPGFKQLVALDAPLATQVWKRFATVQTRKMNIRTVRMAFPSSEGTRQVYSVVRACVSNRYSCYSHLNLVDNLLAGTEGYSKLPVLDWWLTDDHMRIRLAALDETTEAFAYLDPEALLRRPMPIIEVWNSETACASVTLVGGVWRLISNTGFAWHGRRDRSWNHIGEVNRMQERVGGVLQDISRDANELCDLYRKAMNVIIEPREHVGDWMVQELKKYPETTADVFCEKARKALVDATTTPNGSLAAVVDAIALAAQWGDSSTQSATGYETTGLLHQHQIEKVASNILLKGLNIAGGDDLISYKEERKSKEEEQKSEGMAQVPTWQAKQGL